MNKDSEYIKSATCGLCEWQLRMHANAQDADAEFDGQMPRIRAHDPACNT